jgi:hypothetical protein
MLVAWRLASSSAPAPESFVTSTSPRESSSPSQIKVFRRTAHFMSASWSYEGESIPFDAEHFDARQANESR